LLPAEVPVVFQLVAGAELADYFKDTPVLRPDLPTM
jgi:hypothetical protein